MSAGFRMLLSNATDAARACLAARRAAGPRSGASADEQRAAAQAAAVATQLEVSAGVRAQEVGHAITHMKGTRPAQVINDTARTSVRELVEAKPRGQTHKCSEGRVED